MTFVILYIVTFAVFLGLDYVGLSYIVKPTFERHIANWLLDDLRFGAALAFYAFYIAVVIWFVSAPAMADNRSLLWVFGSAALLGAFGYGTYEFTNMATLKDWAWPMVVTDLAWGTFLTATAATVGVTVTRGFSAV